MLRPSRCSRMRSAKFSIDALLLGFPFQLFESKPLPDVLRTASSLLTKSMTPPNRPPGAGSPSANSTVAPSSWLPSTT